MQNYIINSIKIKPKYEHDEVSNQYVRYNINRLLSMFEYKGLPETMPQKFIELNLLINGYVGVTKVNNNLYAMNCGLGGVPDAYYMPTKAIFSNPGLNFNAELDIYKDCEVIYNDSLAIGLLPLLSRYSNLMADNYITLKTADIWSRVTALISASDDNTKASAEEYINKLVKGELSVVGENAFFEGIKAQPLRSGASNELTDIIEVQQYLKASLYNELGLDANYNMKRESIVKSEAEMNKNALKCLSDNMLKERQEGCKRINKLYNTDISVDYNPDGAWFEKYEDIELDGGDINEHDSTNEKLPDDNKDSSKDK